MSHPTGTIPTTRRGVRSALTRWHRQAPWNDTLDEEWLASLSDALQVYAIEVEQALEAERSVVEHWPIAAEEGNADAERDHIDDVAYDMAVEYVHREMFT